MTWTVREVEAWRGFAVEWAERGRFYLSRRHVLYHAATVAAPPTRVAVIDAPRWKALASHSRLAQRLLRFMVTNVAPLPGGDLLVAFDRTVGLVRQGHFAPAAGLRRPCRVLRSACAVSPEGLAYFGEYLANDDRGAIHLYEYTPAENRAAVVHTFAAGSIKHVHGVYHDPYSDAMFCLTGDRDAECRVLRSTDRCRTFETVGAGDESWRAVSLLFAAGSVTYGSDAEYRSNHLYRVDRATLARRSIGEVGGTVFYSKAIGDDLFFATTAENAPSQTDNVAALWHVGADERCRQLVSFAKDRWHPTWFQFGMLQFAGGVSDTEACFHTVGVDGDNRVYRITTTP